MRVDKMMSIRKHGKTARGQKELVTHLEGQKVTMKQAIYARCYDCCGFFSEGKVDCRMPHCPLHPFMAYNANRVKRVTGRKMTGTHMEKMRAARL